jgi:hypothetical protein
VTARHILSLHAIMLTHRLRSLAAAAAVTFFARTASAQGSPALTFDPAAGLVATPAGQNIGWRFDVLSPMTVVGLGWFDDAGDGLTLSHQIGLWSASGTLLATATVSAGTADPLVGQFRTAGIGPLVLTAGTGYTIGGYTTATAAGHDPFYFNAPYTTDPSIAFTGAVYSSFTTSFGRPTQSSAATSGFFGPSFSVTPNVTATPEPATVALVGGGLLVLGAGARRRKRASAE